VGPDLGNQHAVVSARRRLIACWCANLLVDSVQDRFHRRGHLCSNAFDADMLPELNSVNTAFMEQVNAELQILTTSAYNMGQTSFLFFSMLIISLLNRDRRRRREDVLAAYERVFV